jgi:hypothetical protein
LEQTLSVEALQEAEATSGDRAVAAEQAGDPYWQSAQLLAAAEYGSQALTVETQVIALQSLLEPFVLSGLHASGDQQAESFILDQGFPMLPADLASQLGVGQDEIEAIRQALLSVGPSALEDYSTSTAALKAGIVAEAGIALDSLQEAIAIRVGQLGQAVQDIGPQDRQALDTARETIAAGLAQAVPPASLQASIESYLAEVRSLLEQTNNLTALQPDLDFGYTSLANFVGRIANTSQPVAVTSTSGAAETATVNSTFTVPLQATVTDASGNPVSTVAVTFAAPTSGPGGTFAGGRSSVVVLTDANGVATAPAFTANTQGGTYFVVASVSGVSTPAVFALSNVFSTSTVLAVSAVTPLAGVDSVTLSATVAVNAPGSGTPTGTVDFFDTTTAKDLGRAALINGVASLNVGTFVAGGHTIAATYSGDSNFLASSGTASLMALVPATLSGTVFADFNDDGQIDFGEAGISGVSVHLTGTDDLGHAVDRTLQTDGDGAYLFLNLRPGSYYLTKTAQPAGYTAGIDSVGTAGGSLSTTVADQFVVQLAQG